ncbi:hypothetical protein A2331_01540 [Candidatus Falkowbacteria bacterium RIFOXYB2_FULL_34_18]|uniref:Uncharacterized protein n=1 Tax=Candidatus Falkowbacteria bacterium RIFOXYD2_FULL_34_120 TaxID=1798007 RepID=A0A1F5TPI1_9BACT|nr:MAG: hypothetical protein A2331_01540 [Candidatus Falkowbacteria bacterium RIFOXYB2_FULL_34_18]OGF29298.1 MAG: hypothetical protein A2500_05420 [Candidatus Falkowbacteria bacterium RIFOXYC12_FULL_34_55]OGF36414.1 MAG: hypothetical protein A2466_01080 [Candidatus Falkowbacteria bacterium RIFOXYC2_FULL_34_220]OGF38893.1 MAG: hypothetical protein A2515_05840 [Candidatus Falkowbacteria bacterium RIFOXYD12_FULL_34_57]OGF40912.1 MAG: hypothetical protein A2531_04065 [Candidatus Falkowbacteria bact
MANTKKHEQFPVLFNNGKIKIYHNHCDEIFIENPKSGVHIRLDIHPYGKGGLEFTTHDRVEPIRVSNMIGWSIIPR